VKGRARLARDSVPCPFCTASDRRSITTCACEPQATDGGFLPTVDGPPDSLRRRRDGEAAGLRQLPTQAITQADLAALTGKVRRRVVRWFRMQRLLAADAAADMRD
jgi:hypothetical protein